MTDEREEWGEKELLRELNYNPKTGKIYRKDGREAFTSVDRGYKKAVFGKKSWYGHRVAWLLHYGQWPKFEIDHINGIRSDNRIANLRDVSHQINNRNMSIAKRSSSGITGIYRCNKPSCWVPQISIKNRSKNLGATPCLGVAIRRRRDAEKALGFHENHGRESNGY